MSFSHDMLIWHGAKTIKFLQIYSLDLWTEISPGGIVYDTDLLSPNLKNLLFMNQLVACIDI